MTNRKFDKPKINLIIDGIMLLLLALMAGLGFLIKYVLVPGFKRNAIYGGDVELYFWGLDRHQWGSIHLYISFAFLFLILLHIVLHWKMIGCIFRKMIHGKVPRTAVVICLSVVSLFFFIAPLLVSPDIAPLQGRSIHSGHAGHLENGTLRKANQNISVASEVLSEEKAGDRYPENHREHSFSHLEIHGSMTIDEVCGKYSVSANKLTKALDIPSGLSSERIGRLKKRYGFEMEELKEAIVEIKNHN